MKYRLIVLAARSWIAAMTLALTAHAQVSSQLFLQSVRVDGPAPVEFTFSDLGTGATNYAIEFRSELAPGTWEQETNATIIATGSGSFSVQVNSAREGSGFYRVVGLGGTNGPIVIEFNAVTVQVSEGDTALPMLILSQPFNGIVKYTVSGTAMSGDYVELSGQALVNGNTAIIPVMLTDNPEIGRMKYLTLRIEAGTGYQLGAASSVTIHIEENDADWQGNFRADDATLGFILQIRRSNGAYTASLRGDGSGFFPTNDIPAAITFTSNNFQAIAMQVPIAAGATLLNEPMMITLQLEAMNGATGQSVSPDLVVGAGSLITKIPAQPHLNTTNAGTFSLLRPPVTPSTNEVELVIVP